MFVGVRDDGEVIGLQNSRQLMEDIPNAIVSAFGMYDVKVFLNLKVFRTSESGRPFR